MTTRTTTPGTVESAKGAALRVAEVRDARRLSPNSVRVTLGGASLADLPRAAPDGYLKLFFPRRRGEIPALPTLPADGDFGAWYRSYLAMPDTERPPMRTYTLRRRRDHPDGVEIDVDLVLHGDGPGSSWARDVAAGDQLTLTGPYGLYAPRPEHDALLLVGDDTAVPAAGAIVESLRPGQRAEVILEVSSAAEVQGWESPGRVEVTWVHGGPTLLDVLGQNDLPGRRPYVWLAGEASRVRELRRHLVRERGVDRTDVQFQGYWRRGRSEDQAAAEAMAERDTDTVPAAGGDVAADGR